MGTKKTLFKSIKKLMLYDLFVGLTILFLYKKFKKYILNLTRIWSKRQPS